jgi:hypothetical protein
MMATSRFRLSVLQIFAALAILPLGFTVVSWSVAQSPRQNPAIPPDWPAAVANHGTFYRWPLGTIADSPVLFALCTALLIICVLFLIISTVRAGTRAMSS